MSMLTNSGCMFCQAIQKRVQQAWLARAYICHVSFTNIVGQLCAISLLTEVREAWVLRVHQHHNPVSFPNNWEVEDCNSFLLTSAQLGWMALSIQSIITSCFCLVFNINPILIQKWLRTKNLTNSWRYSCTYVLSSS